MRTSRGKDSEREGNSSAERFSKIIFFEPHLGTAGEKSAACLRYRHQVVTYEIDMCSIWVVPRITFVPL